MSAIKFKFKAYTIASCDFVWCVILIFFWAIDGKEFILIFPSVLFADQTSMFSKLYFASSRLLAKLAVEKQQV